MGKNELHAMQADMLLKRHTRRAPAELWHHERVERNSFRYGFAVMLRRHRVDIKTAQEFLRHENSTITMDV